jgi:hypothetical protein
MQIEINTLNVVAEIKIYDMTEEVSSFMYEILMNDEIVNYKTVRYYHDTDDLYIIVDMNNDDMHTKKQLQEKAEDIVGEIYERYPFLESGDNSKILQEIDKYKKEQEDEAEMQKQQDDEKYGTGCERREL